MERVAPSERADTFIFGVANLLDGLVAVCSLGCRRSSLTDGLVLRRAKWQLTRDRIAERKRYTLTHRGHYE